MKENKLILTELDGKYLSFQFEDDVCAQIDVSSSNQESHLNNIYIGKIKNILPNIKAAFVEYTPDVMGYLPIDEIKQYNILNRKAANKPASGDEILVQIKREAHKTKNAALTTNITISGTYCVISLFNKRISFSSKLHARQKTKLKEYVNSIVNEIPDISAGFIIRTNAETLKTPDELEKLGNEMRFLNQTLLEIIKNAANRTVFSCMYKEPDFFTRKVKNIYTSQNFRVITDIPDVYENLLLSIEHNEMGLTSDRKDMLELYKDSSYSLKALYGLRKQLEDAISKKVWLKSGGYIIIEQTEALTVIDVNSGKFFDKKSPYETYYKVNLEAAAEAARQIRLRNLSGIIIIDFINLINKEDEKSLINELCRCLKKDPIKTDFIDITPLGLVEITRKNISKTLYEKYKMI